MTMTDSQATPIDIGPEAQPPFFRPPDLATLFDRRADRLAELAAGHPLEAFLGFMAALTRAQAMALRRLPPGALPGPDEVALCRERGLPPLDRLVWRRDESWVEALRTILVQLGQVEMPGPARAAIGILSRCDDAGLAALANRVLTDALDPADAALACFVTAALQVSWARAAALIDPADIGPLDPPGRCPVCGSPPLASVVHIAGNLQGTRFLHCSLCSSEWHYVRIKCPRCTSTKGIAYYHLAHDGGAVKAESCDECRTYTKILYLDKDHGAEPFADDLASYALDLLVEEAGWRRAAPNPFLTSMPGS